MASGIELDIPTDADEMRLASFWDGLDFEGVIKAYQAKRKEVGEKMVKTSSKKKQWQGRMQGEEDDNEGGQGSERGYYSAESTMQSAIGKPGRKKQTAEEKLEATRDRKHRVGAHAALLFLQRCRWRLVSSCRLVGQDLAT